jgi:pantoate--beta-alanine ligase
VKQIESIDDLRAAIADWREAGARIALVPTMGNLHRGHLALVDIAADHADHVIVSVFVNPTQFGPNEDYEDYPRTLETDARRLARTGADILFAPAVDEMYPGGAGSSTSLSVPVRQDELEGAARPGHFDGVASVVCRLMNICHPDVVVFGQKDYQQLVVLRRMVADLHFPVQIVAGTTVRNEDGLALSSRNNFLDDDQRITATAIYQSLKAVAAMLEEGNRDYAALEQSAGEQISAAGLDPDYVAIRTADQLAVPDATSTHLVVLAAARLGDVRLIDNLLVELAT